MNDLATMARLDIEEIIRTYDNAVRNGDSKLAANIKYAHPDLAARLQ